IKAKPFFEILKVRNQSMWEIFAQLLKDEEQELIFTNEKDEVLFNYILPNTLEKLKKDQEKFTKEFQEKIKN
ncbi:hypothetical protein, partial [Corynebacterium sp. TAE3-ERU30]|uniref:hypothetical protein n=1 Tax=Corynebacterium sp. TAE3-ERU30 TaxID=2849496 RepID=UPI001C46B115